MRVDAWRVHDTGLVAVPTRFRRLGGLVRHLQGSGEPWPDQVVLELLADEDLLGDCRIMRVGLPDRFVTHGKPALLREEVGLTPEVVADRVAQAVLEPSLA